MDGAHVSPEVFATWVRARDALEQLTDMLDDAGDAMLAIGRALRDGLLRSAAATCVFYRGDDRETEHNVLIGADIWERAGTFGSECILWTIGSIDVDLRTASRYGELEDECLNRYHYVRFEREGLAALDPRFQNAQIAATANATTHPAPSRSPSFKTGRAPSDEEIIAKADEMKARGMRGRDIAKNMRIEGGFEDVPTVLVRTLILGRYIRTGRPANREK